MNETARQYCRVLTSADAESDFKIKYGTGMYRNSFCRLVLTGPDCKAVANAHIKSCIPFRMQCVNAGTVPINIK